MKISRPIHSIKKAARSIRAIRERHRARHRSTGFGFLIADSVDFLDAQRWDELTRHSSVWMRRDVLRIIERQGPENLVPRYAMIFRDGIAVAALAVQIVQVTGRRLQSEAAANAGAQDSGKSVVKRLLGAARKIVTKRVNERLLVAGNLLCWGFHGITMQDGVEMPEVWSAVGEAL